MAEQQEGKKGRLGRTLLGAIGITVTETDHDTTEAGGGAEILFTEDETELFKPIDLGDGVLTGPEAQVDGAVEPPVSDDVLGFDEPQIDEEAVEALAQQYLTESASDLSSHAEAYHGHMETLAHTVEQPSARHNSAVALVEKAGCTPADLLRDLSLQESQLDVAYASRLEEITRANEAALKPLDATISTASERVSAIDEEIERLRTERADKEREISAAEIAKADVDAQTASDLAVADAAKKRAGDRVSSRLALFDV